MISVKLSSVLAHALKKKEKIDKKRKFKNSVCRSKISMAEKCARNGALPVPSQGARTDEETNTEKE